MERRGWAETADLRFLAGLHVCTSSMLSFFFARFLAIVALPTPQRVGLRSGPETTG